MRRALAAAALALMLLGVEVSTGVVSLGAVRLGIGLRSVVTGEEFLIPRPRVIAGVWILVAGGAMLATVVYAEHARGLIHPHGSVCPACGAEMRRVRRRRRHRLLSAILEARVTRRSCDKCGWRGLTV